MGIGPRWTPDTSAINWLADDPDARALIAGLQSGFYPSIPFTTIAEAAATTDAARRMHLLRVCGALVSSGDCIDPVGEVIRKLVAHFEESAPFDWAKARIDVPEAQDAIARAEIFTDDLSALEREQSRASEKAFRTTYDDAKPEFDRLFASGSEDVPRSVSELVTLLQKPGGAFWNMAQKIYDRVAARAADDATIRRFTDACDPFRAMMIAIVAAQFDRCMKPSNGGPSLRAGRTDTFMAIYLPYCDEFVTSDPRQLECFKEVALIARLRVSVRTYEDFRRGLLVGATVSR
jgi:hypothetical protein